MLVHGPGLALLSFSSPNLYTPRAHSLPKGQAIWAGGQKELPQAVGP